MPKFTRGGGQPARGHSVTAWDSQELRVAANKVLASWEIGSSLATPFVHTVHMRYGPQGLKFKAAMGSTYEIADWDTGLGLPTGQFADCWIELRDSRGELVLRTDVVRLVGVA